MVQTGRASIASLNEASITLKGAGTSLFVVLVGAKFDDGPQIFFTASLTGSFQVPGVSIALANHDWLFLSDEAIPANMALAHLGQPGRVQPDLG